MKTIYALCAMLMLPAAMPAQSEAPAAIQPVPTKYQVELMQMGTYAFIHFGPNTFQNKEWGYGDADPSVFNPDTLDCDPWVRTLQGGGMGGVIFAFEHPFAIRIREIPAQGVFKYGLRVAKAPFIVLPGGLLPWCDFSPAIYVAQPCRGLCA